MNGEEYAPKIVVIGFDGCWTTSDLYGTPHGTFNHYVSPALGRAIFVIRNLPVKLGG